MTKLITERPIARDNGKPISWGVVHLRPTERTCGACGQKVAPELEPWEVRLGNDARALTPEVIEEGEYAVSVTFLNDAPVLGERIVNIPSGVFDLSETLTV